MATSHGPAISAPNCRKLIPAALSASRFVRLETGSSREAELDRCAVAYTCGVGLTPERAAVANTTGVSSTTVASRLRTAVTRAETANTSPSSVTGRPFARRAMNAPAAANIPSASHSFESISTPARKAMVGAIVVTCSQVSPQVMSPVAATSRPAGAAATASGRPRGRMMANASTATSSTMAMGSASPSLTATRYLRGPSDGYGVAHV